MLGFVFWIHESKKANTNELTDKRTRPLQGEAGPLGREISPCKSNHNKTPTKDHPRPTCQGQPPDHQVSSLIHLFTDFSPPIPLNAKVIPPTKDIPSTPHVRSNPWSMATAKKTLILI